MIQTSSSNGSLKPGAALSFSTDSSKYDGLIQESKVKKFTKSMINVLNYIDSMISPLNYVHSVVSVWRLIQIFGYMFLSNFRTLNPDNSTIHKFFNYFSILWNVVPIDYRDKSSFIIAVIYFAGTSIFFGVFAATAYYYQHYGTLNVAAMYFIHLFISVPGYLLQGPLLEICFETIGKIIASVDTYWSLGYNIATWILVIITYFTWYFFYRQIYSFSLVFRPTSLMTITGWQQMATFQTATFSAIIVGLATFLPRTSQGVFMIIGSLASLSAYFSIYKNFVLVSFWHNSVFLCFTISGLISYLAFAIMIFLKKEMTIAGFFIWIIALFVIFILSHFIQQFMIKKALLLLDRIYDDKSVLEEYKHLHHLYTCSLIGFRFSHPISLDFTIFKHITERDPDNENYWITYAKLVAIYPELSDVHQYIVQTIMNKKWSSGNVKQMLAQSNIIFQQRETNLTADLKKKLQKVSKEIGSCKRRLRHIWDQVIQGNIAEMDGAIASAYQAIQETDASFALLLTQLPNNRFLYRTYANYLYDVTNDMEKYKEISDATRLLSRGIRVHSDHTQELGFRAFPNLPQILTQSTQLQLSSVNEMSESAVFIDEIDEETITKRIDETRSLNDLIDNLKIPSLKLTIVIISIVVGIVIVAAVICLILSPSYRNRVQKPIKLLDAVNYASYYATVAVTMAHQYILEHSMSSSSMISR